MRQVTTSPCIPVPLTSGYLWEPRQRTAARYQGFEINIIKYNKLETCGYLKKLAGAAGIEPANGGIKSRCLTAWRRPSKPVI